MAGGAGGSAGSSSSAGGLPVEPPTGAGHGAASIGGAMAGGLAGAPGGSGASMGSDGGAPLGGSGGWTSLTGTPLVYVGCFGSAVRSYELDPITGALVQRGGDFDAGPNPSYLALGASRQHLYAANVDDSPDGGVTALLIRADGSLERLNHQTGSDGGFAHLAVSPDGKLLAAAAFNGGSVSVFPITADGSLGPELSNLDLGDGSEAHAVAFDASGTQLLVPTRGTDHVEQLLLGESGLLTHNQPPFVALPPGSGPRHIALHPHGRLAFVVSEKANTVSSYVVSKEGTLSGGQTVSTLPDGFDAGNDAAHIELSPDGRFVYASNRGHDSVAVFSADASSGALALLEHESTRGSTPRDFDVDPNGSFVIVANQESSTLAVFVIEDDGRLGPLGSPIPSLSNPTAVQIHYLR